MATLLKAELLPTSFSLSSSKPVSLSARNKSTFDVSRSKRLRITGSESWKIRFQIRRKRSAFRRANMAGAGERLRSVVYCSAFNVYVFMRRLAI